MAPREGQAESDREDSGYLALFVHDSLGNKSYFELLSAADLSLVARVRIPTRVPYGLHGAWIEGEDLGGRI